MLALPRARPFPPGDSAECSATAGLSSGRRATAEPRDAGAAAREGPALAAGLAPGHGRHGASAPSRPAAGPAHRAHLGDAGTHEAAADDRDMLDEQLLGGGRGGVGGGGAHELAGSEGHGEGAARAAGPRQAGPGRAGRGEGCAPPRGKAAGSGCPVPAAR